MKMRTCVILGEDDWKPKESFKRARFCAEEDKSEEIEETKDYFSFYTGATANKLKFEIGGVEWELFVDSGSDVTVIQNTSFEKLKAKGVKIASMKTNENNLGGITENSELNIRGCFNTEIRTGKWTTLEKVFVAYNIKADLLGSDAAKALKVLKVGYNVAAETKAPNVKNTSVFPMLPGYETKLYVDSNIRPIIQKLRQVPIAVEEPIKRKIQEMMDKDIIEKISTPSEWVSPIVPIKKPNGDYRITVDYRRLNQAIKTQGYKMPDVENFLTTIPRSVKFSKLDFPNAFFLIKLEESSRRFTTFITNSGLYRFKRLAMGLKCAPEEYQKAMDQLFAGLEGIRIYMDDLLIFGETDKIHDKNLKAVMNRIEELGIPINKEKSEIGVSKIHFLGHIISKEGIRPAEDKLSVVKNFREPNSKEELRSFLGFITFLGRFVPDLSKMTDPLRGLLKKDTVFEWKEQHSLAFKILKKHASQSRCLTVFDNTRKTRLYVDAGPDGLGAVLSQLHGDEWRVIAYASKGLTELERKYSQTEREALAIVWGCEKFRYYLLGRKFQLLTDCRALKFMFSAKADPHARIERWALRLQIFDFEIIHIDGTANIADPFSRMAQFEDYRQIGNDLVLRTILTEGSPTSISLIEIQKETLNDSELSKVLEALETGNWGKVNETYTNIQHQICEYEGLVLRGERIIIPKRLQEQIIALSHEGHPGKGKMKERLRSKVWFPQMEAAVDKAVRNCKGCIMTSLPNRPMPLKPRNLPESPWEAVSLDYKQVGKAMVLVLIDYYSRYTVYEVVEPATAKETAAAMRKIYSMYGVPGLIQCDNGSHFKAEFITHCHEFGIVITRSAPHYAQANGEVERTNREFKRRLQMAVSMTKDWEQALADYVLMFHSTPHTALGGLTPAEAFFNRKVKDKLPEISKYTHPADERIRDVDTLYKEKSRKYTDKVRKAKIPELDVGDIVMSQNFQKGGLIPNFGPQEYRITEITGPEATIEETDNSTKRLKRHLTHLKKLPRQENPEHEEANENMNVEVEPEEEPEPEEIVEAQQPAKRQRRRPIKLIDYEVTLD